MMNSFKRFSEKKLPNKDNFYSILNNEHISDMQYVYAIKVWNTFKLKNMKLTSKPTFVTSKIFNEKLVAIHKIKETFTLNRPAYVGMCILQ